MHLSPLEARLISELRSVPTCQIIVTQTKGTITRMETRIDARIADKAHGKEEIWNVPRGTEKNLT